MLAYPGGEAQKSEIVAELIDHAKYDRLVKGIYWEDGKGCAVGCTIKSDDHMEYETRFGIPVMLARLEDGIFECLPNDLEMTWPVEFMSAIPVGADLSLVGWKFLDRLLSRAFASIDKDSDTYQGCLPAIDIVSAKANGKEVTAHAAHAADAAANAANAAVNSANAAYAAAYAADHEAHADNAAYAAAHAADAAANSANAAYAADHAANAAAHAADAAAHAAYAANAAYAAAYAAERISQRNDLLELLAQAPIAA